MNIRGSIKKIRNDTYTVFYIPGIIYQLTTIQSYHTSAALDRASVVNVLQTWSYIV